MDGVMLPHCCLRDGAFCNISIFTSLNRIEVTLLRCAPNVMATGQCYACNNKSAGNPPGLVSSLQMPVFRHDPPPEIIPLLGYRIPDSSCLGSQRIHTDHPLHMP